MQFLVIDNLKPKQLYQKLHHERQKCDQLEAKLHCQQQQHLAVVKSLELKIQELNQQLHNNLIPVQGVAKLGNFTIDIASKMWCLSPEFWHILGRKPQNFFLNQAEFLQLIHPQDCIRVQNYFEHTIKQAIANNTKFWIAKSDYSWRYVHVHSQPVRNESGQLVELFSTITDITDIKKTESRLKTSEKRYRAVVEDQTELICRFFPDGTITFANQAYCRHLNIEIEQLIGHNLLDLVTPEEQFEIRQRLQNLFDLTPSSQWVRIDHGATKTNGEVVWQSWTYRGIFDNQQQMVEIQAVGRDITELKQTQQQLKTSQQKYKTLFETLPIGVAISDQAGKIIEVNSALENILGLSNLITEEFRLDNLTAKLLGSDGKVISREDCAIYQAWQENRIVYNQQRALVNNHQILNWLSITTAPIPLEGFGIVVACLDITESKQAAQMKEEFLTVASHELRTPLTSLKGSLGLLKTGQLGQLNDTGQQLLEFAFLDTERLVRLVKDILDLQRLKIANQALKVDLYPTEQLIEQAIRVIEPLAQQADINLFVDTSNVKVWVNGDRLIQVLTNLLGNAIKFSPPGGKVALKTEVQPEQILFKVIDNGRGIPIDQQELIFEPFRQVYGSDAHQHQGTGLGLAICRTIVEQHGGEIGVESAPGEGSIFYFTIPR